MEMKFVNANGIQIAAHEQGAGPAIVLLHGFPELAFSWRHQMPALARAGWRAIAPDLRGYGLTGPRGDATAYSMRNLAKDVIGMLDAFRIERAVIVGHDFGGALAWSIGRDHPNRVTAVVSLNTPYTRRTSEDLAASMLRHRGETNYMVQFQKPGLGEAYLGQDIAGMFKRLIRRPAMSLQDFRRSDARLQALPMTVFGGEPQLIGAPVMGEEELSIYIEAFRRTGFTGALNWYRNHRQNWLDSEAVDDRVLTPSLMISAADDFFLPPETTRGMERHVPDLERRVIQHCGHWTQHEQPDVVNELTLEWLERRVRPTLV